MLISSGHGDDGALDSRDVDQRGQEVEHLFVVRLLLLFPGLGCRVRFRFRRLLGRSGRREVVLGGVLHPVFTLLLSLQPQDLLR